MRSVLQEFVVQSLRAALHGFDSALRAPLTMTGVSILILVGCNKPPPAPLVPLERIGPVGLAVPAAFVESTSLEKKVGDATQAGPGAARSSRVWRDEAAKVTLSLTLARLPHQAEWSAYPAGEALNEIVNQAIQAGERAGLETVRGARTEEGPALRYELDSKMIQAGKTLFTFNRAGMWLDHDGSLMNASAVCTADESNRDRCTALLKTLAIEVPPDARALDGGA